MLPRARVLLTVVVAAVLSVLAAAPASADTSDFEFRSFHGDYTLSQAQDGTSRLDVVETVVAVFPDYDQNRGIIRAIPNYYQRVFLDPQVTSVTDENGDDVPFELADAGDFLEIALGDDDYVHGATTYVIGISLSNVVGTFDDTGDDEFYWDTNGTGAAQSFGSVSADVHIDPALTPALTGEPSCYRGAADSTDGCAIAVSEDPATGGTLYSASEQGFGPGENLSVAIGFAQGTFVQGEKTQPVPVEPSTTAPWWSNLISIVVGGGSLVVVVGAIIARIRRGNGAKGRGIIVPQYSVPQNLNVMAAANLVGRQASAIPAQIVSLAVRKNIRILDYPVTESGADYTLQYLGDEGADPLALKMLAAFFGDEREVGEVRELAPDDGALGTKVHAVAAESGAELIRQRLRERLVLRGWPFPVVGFVLAALAFVNIFATAFSNSIAPWPFTSVFAAVLAVIVSALLVQRKGLLTEAGAEQRDYLLGMKMYLTLAEKERFRVLQSPDGAERVDVGDTKQIVKLYEKLLPFAVLWGVEEEWAKELEVKLQQDDVELDWYTGRGAFTAVALTGALHGVSGAATFAPASTSSSWTSGPGGGSSFGSSFGGTGGGGFSGGGGGGGGFGGR